MFPLVSEGDFTALDSFEKKKSSYDPAITWTASSTIYYSTYESNGKKYVTLHNFDLQWKPTVSNVSISNRRYKYANNGHLNGTLLNQISPIIYTTSNTVSSKPPTTWKSPEVTDLWAGGVNMYATLTRSTSIWNFTYTHNMSV